MADNRTYGDTVSFSQNDSYNNILKVGNILRKILYISVDGSWEGILWEDKSYLCTT